MEENKHKRLPFKHKLGYGFGDAGGCMTFALMGLYFPLMCTDALGIDEKLLSILLLVWNIWDFINDPMMGALMDKSFAKKSNKRGKFRPWILRAAPLICVTFIALWTVPHLLDGIALLGVLFAFKLLYEASYTMFNIPMGSLLSAMSTDDEERASLSTWRGIGSGIGNMIPAVVAPALINYFGKNNGTGYAITATICAVVGFIFCLLHYFMTKENHVVLPQNDEQKENIKLTDILNVFKTNRAFIALCLHGLFICLMQYTSSTLSAYLYTGLYNDLDLASVASGLSAPFMAFIFIFGSKLAKKFSLEKVIRVTLLIGSILYLALFGLHMITYVGPYLHMIWSSVAMGIGSISIYMQWGLVGEAIDYNEMITGKRTEGSIFGTFNLSRRIGQAIATSGAIFLLGQFGYDENLITQTPTTVFGIKLLCLLLPGIFILGSWIAFKFVWNIKKETKDKISEYKQKQFAAIENEEGETNE